MFLDRRVYQGSSGRVYPLPVVDRISEERVDRAWQAVHLQNEHLRVMVLPELGGRIHVIRDLASGYDLVYRQDVIKPALVGLAGPWASGGIELNWPQHHRPATFMPTEVHLEAHPDGSRTAWFSDHDPMNRLKGMHGVRLRPGDARVELCVRLYNRTPLVQTFLWWANVAVEVHEDYQSFFPPDVRRVADHARRATSTFPRCQGTYYGVDYGSRERRGVPPAERPARFAPRPGRQADDLTWYANIPVPTSYMAVGSAADFAGGYDHAAEVGIVHVADHHLSPGKKQWTWGNHEFGYAWDRHLTDPDERGIHRPYIELMAGVYTDNQPDFSFLGPGETRTFTQVWYPLHRIGPAQAANRRAALSLSVRPGAVRVGVAVPVPIERARVRLRRGPQVVAEWTADLRPGRPLLEEAEAALPAGTRQEELRVEVTDAEGREVIAYQPAPPPAEDFPTATEPPDPREVGSADELHLIGVHLEQYRHATRSPEAYWEEALRRDPLDSRCNTALGFRKLRRGAAGPAEAHFRAALRRLQHRNANPFDGEAFYGLGLALRLQRRDEEAFAAFAKGTWNAAWAGPCHHALAELHCGRGDLEAALAEVQRAVARDADNLRARGLGVALLQKLGRDGEATAELERVLALDPLDAWGRHLAGRGPRDGQLVLDLALDHARAGLDREALALLEAPGLEVPPGAAPLVHYCAAWLADRLGQSEAAAQHRRAASRAPSDYCFPARLEEIGILEAAMAAAPDDARAPAYLGHLLYDRGRRDEAIALWERAVALDPSSSPSSPSSIVWRNLGIAYFNVRREPARALEAYRRAREAAPADARLLYEHDQLRKRTGAALADRLVELESRPELVTRRDDLTVELCALLLQAGRPEEALRRLTDRRFQPWEGGEGLALEQHTRARLALASSSRARGDLPGARQHLEAALHPPESLGEARHPLASAGDVFFALGELCLSAGQEQEGRRWLEEAAGGRGDFQGMRVEAFSDVSWWSALALDRLGRAAEAKTLLQGLEAHAAALLRTPARIDYFATSLPTMLLFEDDLQQRQDASAHLMLAQARLGLGDPAGARRHLDEALRRDPWRASAVDLRRRLDGR
jgi:tetratricopeptide (TPR) repeat protein